MAIGLAIGEDVTGSHQEFAGDGDDGLAGMLGFLEVIVLSLPVRVGANSAPGGFDESPAEFLAALLGDGFVVVFLAADVDTGTEASIADEFFRGREAGDVADGSEEDHGEEDAKAGELHQKDHIRSPGVRVAQFSQFLVDDRLLGFELLDDLEIALHLNSGQVGERQLAPPVGVLVAEEIAFRGREVEALDDAVEAVFGHDDLPAEAPAEGNQGAEFADVLWGHPDLGDDIGDEEGDEALDVCFVGFGASFGDLADFARVSDDDLGDQRGNDVVDVPGIASGLDDNSVARFEVVGGPVAEARHTYFAGAQDPFFEFVLAANEDIVLVQVDGDKALDRY